MSGIRVLHCPKMVGGCPQQLARAEREVGLVESLSVAFDRRQFDYEGDEVLFADSDNLVVREIKRWRLLWRAIRKFDIVHFNFGQSIMPIWVPPSARPNIKLHWSTRLAYCCYARLFELRDLPLLKLAGKGIFVTFQGDDARQGDYCSDNFEISPAGEVEPGYYSAEFDAHKRKRIAIFARYADRIFSANPDLLNVLPANARFMPYPQVDLRQWQIVPTSDDQPDVPTVVHAPSHRGVKGTRFILDAVARLKDEGIGLNFILVEGLTRSQARRIYERADLLIDQLLCGWYGGLAVELMALGKPVLCYIRKSDLKFIPEQMQTDLPIIEATPSTIYDVLKQWLTVRKNELSHVGRRGRAYVEKWHDPLKIAAQLKSEYEAVMASKRGRVST